MLAVGAGSKVNSQMLVSSILTPSGPPSGTHPHHGPVSRTVSVGELLHTLVVIVRTLDVAHTSGIKHKYGFDTKLLYELVLILTPFCVYISNNNFISDCPHRSPKQTIILYFIPLTKVI